MIEIRRLFEEFAVSDCMREYGKIRWQLEQKGQRIDSIDLLIGATALSENLTLVTGNVKHFNRIPGLKIENWME